MATGRPNPRQAITLSVFRPSGSDLLRLDSVIAYLTPHSAAEAGAQPALMSLQQHGQVKVFRPGL